MSEDNCKNFDNPKMFPVNAYLMLPAHFHNDSKDHIWSKTLQELKARPARNARAILKH